ncbi:MAG: helix-turn-helix transcriptional regulator [Bacteroidales bacterium]|nr:helix-turn-helix transcriptional regulator [Bacteroidales bacterium]
MDDIYVLTDSQIQSRIGGKIKTTRLKQNITQASLAHSAGISRSSLQKMEMGEIGSFDTFLRVLRTLGLLDQLASLCEEPQLSPSEYYEIQNSLKRQQRKRASGVINNNEQQSTW